MRVVGNVSRKTTTVIVGPRNSPIEVLAAAFEKPHARTGSDLPGFLAGVADVTLPFIPRLPRAECNAER